MLRTMGKSKQLGGRTIIDLHKLGRSLGAISKHCRFQNHNFKQLYGGKNPLGGARVLNFVLALM